MVNIQKIYYFSNQQGGKDIAVAASGVPEADQMVQAFHKLHGQKYNSERYRMTAVFASAAGLAAIIVEDFCAEIINEESVAAVMGQIIEGGG